VSAVALTATRRRVACCCRDCDRAFESANRTRLCPRCRSRRLAQRDRVENALPAEARARLRAQRAGVPCLFDRIPIPGGWVHRMMSPDGVEMRVVVPAY